MVSEKMTVEEFCNKENEIRSKVASFKENLYRTEYHPFEQKFIFDNNPYKKGVVYEIEKNGIKRRGFKRFVIVDFFVNMISSKGVCKHATIFCEGYWLDVDGNMVKQDIMSVFGFSNDTIFKVSENQNYIKKEVGDGE